MTKPPDYSEGFSLRRIRGTHYPPSSQHWLRSRFRKYVSTPSFYAMFQFELAWWLLYQECRRMSLGNVFSMSESEGIVTESTLTCPTCGLQEKLDMPTDSCVWAWTCPSCGNRQTPLEGDCCVFCSYGSVSCPSIQESVSRGNKSCC